MRTGWVATFVVLACSGDTLGPPADTESEVAEGDGHDAADGDGDAVTVLDGTHDGADGLPEAECTRDDDCPTGGTTFCFVGRCLGGVCAAATRPGRCDFDAALDGLCVGGVCLAGLPYFAADDSEPVIPAPAQCDCRDLERP